MRLSTCRPAATAPTYKHFFVASKFNFGVFVELRRDSSLWASQWTDNGRCFSHRRRVELCAKGYRQHTNVLIRQLRNVLRNVELDVNDIRVVLVAVWVRTES